MSPITEMKDEHTQIIDRLLEIQKIGVSDIEKAFKLLRTSATYIVYHLEKENNFLYPALNKSKDTETLYITSQMEYDMKSISIDVMYFFDEYKNIDDIKQDTYTYLESLNRIIVDLKKRMKKEDEILYPLLSEEDNLVDYSNIS
jgi:iron-sulfur cluster repair protein YtfE (RIC family)